MDDTTRPRYPDPNAGDQTNFLLRLYFPGEDTLTRILKRAYQDLSRTVHGIGEHQLARPQAERLLRSALVRLADSPALSTQADFDGWHRQTCEGLCGTYTQAGYQRFRVGQAQKWLNMAVKYLYVFGDARLPGYGKFYRFAHVPIDNVVLNSYAFAGLRNFAEAWSRLEDYDTYLAFQRSVRERYPLCSPLALEFWAWQGQGEAHA